MHSVSPQSTSLALLSLTIVSSCCPEKVLNRISMLKLLNFRTNKRHDAISYVETQEDRKPYPATDQLR